MNKIVIVRESLPDGRRWHVKNWNEYVACLEAEGARTTPVRFVQIGIDEDLNWGYYYGDFERQVPATFGLDPEDAEIVDK